MLLPNLWALCAIRQQVVEERALCALVGELCTQSRQDCVGIKYPLLLTTILMILGHFVPIRALYAHCDQKQLWFGTLVPREHKCATVGI